MSDEVEYWTAHEMFCPRCRSKVTGYKDKKGLVKLRCETCGTVGQ